MKDAIALLKQDHANVKAMFKEFEGLGERAFTSKKSWPTRSAWN